MIFQFYPRTMTKHSFLIISLALLLPIKNAASATTLDAHEHGNAMLNIAADGNVLFIEFESPAANIVGFEQTPKTTEQTAKVEATINLLEDFKSIFHLSDSAACNLNKASVNWVDSTGGHAEFQAEYQLICEQIDQLEAIDVLLFNSFPNIEDVDVQAIFPDSQIAIELSPGRPVIVLK